MRGKTNPFPSSEFALLGLLIPGPCHGYELHKKMNESDGIGLIWGVKMANLYAQLDKLERNGLVTSNSVTSDNHPNRKQFDLTEKGREAFEEWLVKPISHPRDFRQEFMVRYYFMSRERPELLTSYLASQTKICADWLEAARNRDEHAPTKGTFDKAIIHFRQSQIESMLEWLIWLQLQYNSIQEEIL